VVASGGSERGTQIDWTVWTDVLALWLDGAGVGCGGCREDDTDEVSPHHSTEELV